MSQNYGLNWLFKVQTHKGTEKFSDWDCIETLAYYMNIAEVTYEGKNLFVARTGYTGEVGYELYIPNDIVARII